jgi:hypothetical protein
MLAMISATGKRRAAQRVGSANDDASRLVAFCGRGPQADHDRGVGRGPVSGCGRTPTKVSTFRRRRRARNCFAASCPAGRRAGRRPAVRSAVRSPSATGRAGLESPPLGTAATAGPAQPTGARIAGDAPAPRGALDPQSQIRQGRRGHQSRRRYPVPDMVEPRMREVRTLSRGDVSCGSAGFGPWDPVGRLVWLPVRLPDPLRAISGADQTGRDGQLGRPRNARSTGRFVIMSALCSPFRRTAIESTSTLLIRGACPCSSRAVGGHDEVGYSVGAQLRSDNQPKGANPCGSALESLV